MTTTTDTLRRDVERLKRIGGGVKTIQPGANVSVNSADPENPVVSASVGVTSVNGSGGTTGLSVSGGPVTSVGTLTIGGTLAVANGGTGATTAAAARSNLGAGTGNGSVTTVSSGNASPLFTVSVGSPTSAPAFSFTRPAQTANIGYFGPTTGAAAAPTFRAMVEADLPGGNWLSATRGEATRTASTNISADATWTDSLLSVMLASAGTYLVTAVVPVSINVTALGSSPRIIARLFNVTGGGAIGASYTPCVEAQIAGTTIVGCATISNIITAAANTTVRVEIFRTAGPTYTTSNLFYVASFYVPRMNYVRLA